MKIQFSQRTMSLTLMLAWLVFLLSSLQPSAARTNVAKAAVAQGIQAGLPGSLDTTFGNGGIVTTAFETISNPNVVAIQPDGKIVVAGYDLYTPGGVIAIARYNTDGSLDNSFGGDGKVITIISGYDFANAVAIQADGKIVVTGATGGSGWDILVARYNSDGSLDTSFHGNGIVMTDTRSGTRIYEDIGYGVAIQTDGKIVISGSSFYLDPDTLDSSDGNSVVARYNSDGSLDASFGRGGIVSTGTGNPFGFGMALQPDGKIVVVGNSFEADGMEVVRYNANGSLDTPFGNNGKAVSPASGGYGLNVALQADGKIVVVGSISHSFMIVRFSDSGSPDTSFGIGGVVTTAFGQQSGSSSIAIHPTGKIVAAGSSDDEFALACYNPDGSLDTSFGGDGKVMTAIGNRSYATSVTIQPDGKIVAAGRGRVTDHTGDFAVVRYNGPTAIPYSNLIDDPQFFVPQHYRDFLNREPDPDGLNFWTAEILVCGSDPQCIEVKRINVSASFFLSIESQETGYLVYRFYQASFGHLPDAPVPIRFDEFLPDTQEIGSGVIVRQAGWEQKLENNKQAFANDFVQRARFTAAYPTTLSPDAFVDTLFAKADVTPTSDDRTAATSEFGGASTTADVAARARSLRRVAENLALAQQEFNRAFVLMQYFGYLRRNPNDAPDGNFDGYNFWLDKLNRFNGDYNQAEMVKAFLSSIEYRRRFGP